MGNFKRRIFLANGDILVALWKKRKLLQYPHKYLKDDQPGNFPAWSSGQEKTTYQPLLRISNADKKHFMFSEVTSSEIFEKNPDRDRFFHKDKRHGLVVRIADILVKIWLK